MRSPRGRSPFRLSRSGRVGAGIQVGAGEKGRERADSVRTATGGGIRGAPGWAGLQGESGRDYSGGEGRGYEARRGRGKAVETPLKPSSATGGPAPRPEPSAPAPVEPAERRGGGSRKGGVVKPHPARQRGRLRAHGAFARLRGASGRG